MIFHLDFVWKFSLNFSTQWELPCKPKNWANDVDQMLYSPCEQMKNVKDIQIGCVQDFCDIKFLIKILTRLFSF